MTATRIEAPKFAVLKASGINRDFATQAALEAAGARADIVMIGTLTSEPRKLFDYQGLIIPGGFSYGDDIQSGAVLALEMQRMKVELEEFALTHKRLVIGVCNGFQALVQSGLLPFGEIVPRDRLKATLTNNASGLFESRWINLKPQKNVSLCIHEGDPVTFPVDHGEGRFFASAEIIHRIEDNEQVVYRYCDHHGNPIQEYPANPNGSVNAIAGITDQTGVIIGLMPHPEDFIRPEHHPNWRRRANGKPDGLQFFENIVLYAREI